MSYRITMGGESFCASNFEHSQVLNPKVVLEANKSGSLTFTLMPDHPYYDSIVFRQSIFDVYQNGKQIFEGIAVSESTDFMNRKTIVCEGELTFLNDSVQRQAVYQNQTITSLLAAYLAVHNAQADESKQFSVGIVTVDGGSNIYRYTNYNSTMQEIQEDLVQNFGGFFRVRHDDGVRYLDYLSGAPHTSSQTVRIGKNLVDFSRNMSSLDICTVLIPLGAKTGNQLVDGLDERLTIESVNSGLDYLVGTAQAYYGNVWKTQVWDDVTTAAALKEKGQTYLSEVQWTNLVISASAIDLGLTSEDVEQFQVLDMIRVISEPHGLDRYFMLTKLELDLDHPGNTKITLGQDSRLSMSARSAKIEAQIERQQTSLMVDASETARMILDAATNGAIQFLFNDSGVMYEMRINDSSNPGATTSYWRYNLGGWGYYDGATGTYKAAATMDGALLANIITAGILKSRNGTTFYLDLDNGILKGNFTELKIGASNAATETYADNAASSAATSAASTAQQNAIAAAGQALNNFITGDYAQDIADLQSQIDGQIETYFDSYVPTMSNAPANTWTTTTDKDNHLGDLFYVVDDPDHGGECYRFALIEGVYGWQLVEDSAVANALRQAQEAYALAGDKKRVFTAQPVPPYEVGDLWVDGSDLRFCDFPRSTGSYVASDWSMATDYLDGAAVDTKITAYDGTLNQSAVFNKLTNNGQEQGLYYSNGKIYLNAQYIGTGYLSADRIQANSISVSKLTGSIKDSGNTWNIDLTNGTITIGNISAAKITTGTLSADRIGANSITAGKLSITDLNAIGATIGGFKIESNSLHTNGVDITSNADNSVGLSSSTFTRTIGGVSRSNLKFALGGNFGVTNTGAVYCKSAVIDYATITNATISNGSIAISTATGTTSYITLTYKTNYYASMAAGRFIVSNSDNGLKTQYEGGGLLTFQYSNSQLRMSCTAAGGLYFVNASNVTTARYPEDSKYGYAYLGMATGSSSYNSVTVTNIEQYRAFALCTMRGQGVGVMATTIIPQEIAKLCTSDERCSWVYCAQNGNYHGQCYFAWSSGKIYLKGSANADSRLYIYGIR